MRYTSYQEASEYLNSRSCQHFPSQRGGCLSKWFQAIRPSDVIAKSPPPKPYRGVPFHVAPATV